MLQSREGSPGYRQVPPLGPAEKCLRPPSHYRGHLRREFGEDHAAQAGPLLTDSHQS
ncbi:unnamed protein product [Symbiodinium microadriaticum]|nr:unnamed protein product [Symbiodinium microadriaticum]